MKTIRYCKSCTHPNTRPRITFNEDGICNGCLRNEEKKNLDWAAKEREFKAIVDRAMARQSLPTGLWQFDVLSVGL